MIGYYHDAEYLLFRVNEAVRADVLTPDEMVQILHIIDDAERRKYCSDEPYVLDKTKYVTLEVDKE